MSASEIANLLERREFRIALGVGAGLLLLVVAYWAELKPWWPIVILWAVAGLVAVITWGSRRRALLILVASNLILILLKAPQLFNLKTADLIGIPVSLAFSLSPLLIDSWGLILTAGVFGFLLLGLYQPEAGSEHAAGTLLYVAASFLFPFLAGLALMAQFVLPTWTMKERWSAFRRLLSYVLLKHGPALRIKDGYPVASDSRERTGPGVILVDGYSAVVLQREIDHHLARLHPHHFELSEKWAARACGPGIVFTDPDEKVRDAVDLRRHSRFTGEVHGLTREGIEVWGNLVVLFSLIPPPNDKKRRIMPEYPYNPDSVFRAVYGRAAASEDLTRWTELPRVVAKEIYRDLLSQETVDHLFQPTAPSGSDPLADFRSTFSDRVKKSELLKERGIQVITALVTGFSFPKQGLQKVSDSHQSLGQNGSFPNQSGEPDKTVLDQRFVDWRTEWEKQKTEVLAGGDLQTARIRHRARSQAQREWLATLTQIMQLQSKLSKPAVAFRLFQALETAASDPSTRKLLPRETISMFNTIAEWFKLQ